MREAGDEPSRRALGEGKPVEAMVSKCWQIVLVNDVRLGHG